MRFFLAVLLLCLAAAARADAPRLEPASRIDWNERWDDFGGFSGLLVAPDGMSFTTISDRGTWATGDFERRNGELRSADMTAHGRLRSVKGGQLRGPDGDAEGLAVGPDGQVWISFEVNHRVRSFGPIDSPAETVRSHPDFAKLQRNSGLETLAIDADGVLYAIPERSGALSRPFPVYRYRDGSWDKTLRIRRDGDYLPVDADFGPDGKLYLLERHFTYVGGFTTRIRRFTLGADGFGDEQTLLRTPFRELDNMEGLATWRDDQGRIRVLLIADDNFFPLQQTIFAEYFVVEQ
jgi:hypothetical protein